MKICKFLTLSFCLVIASHTGLLAQTIDFAALDFKGGKKSSSGCVLMDDKGTVATVVELGSDAKKATLVVGDKRVTLNYITNDIDSRVAIYQIPAESLSIVKRVAMLGSSANLQSGSPVYPSANDRSQIARVVTKLHRFHGKVLPLAVYRLNHSAAAPKPGSGIYDENGKLVGLIRQAVYNVQNSSYCLPIEVVDRIRQDHKKNGEVGRCWIGIIMDELVDSPIVVSVRPESPAKKAGVEKGDIILSIGSSRVSEYAHVVDTFYYLVAGEQKKFKILRGTEIKELTIVPEVSPSR